MRTIVCAAVLIAAGGYLAVSTLGGSDSRGPQLAQGDEPGLPPAPAEAAAEAPTPEQEAEAIAAARAGATVRRQAKADPSSIPPASAGSNGSYTPPPPEERRRIAARVHTPDGTDTDESSILLGGTAIAPPGSPEQVQDFVSAANSIVGQPYRFGGGHASFRSRGYDCSGAVSYGLAGAGLLGAPATSGQLMSWGEPGPGRWLTIYAKPSHVYAVVGGLRWDTVGNARGTGPRWHPYDAYPQGYIVRHLPTL